ncbi:MAG: hypothetical protein R6W95_02215 [Desulfosarcina sp.]
MTKSAQQVQISRTVMDAIKNGTIARERLSSRVLPIEQAIKRQTTKLSDCRACCSTTEDGVALQWTMRDDI